MQIHEVPVDVGDMELLEDESDVVGLVVALEVELLDKSSVEIVVEMLDELSVELVDELLDELSVVGKLIVDVVELVVVVDDVIDVVLDAESGNISIE